MNPYYKNNNFRPEDYGSEPYRMVDISRRWCRGKVNYTGFHVLVPSEITLAKEVIEREQPIRFDVLCRRLSPLFNLEGQRITNDLRAKTKRLIANIKPEVINRRGFVYLSSLKEICVRYRTGDAFHERKTEDICHEEMMQALSNIGRLTSKITKEELIDCAVRVFGYSRKGGDLCSRLESALTCMIQRQDVLDSGLFLRFQRCPYYRMGDYCEKGISQTEKKVITSKSQTAASSTNNCPIPYCYYTVGDFSDADDNGFLTIEIEKELLMAMRSQRRSFAFKVTDGEKIYLYAIGSKKINNAVNKKGKWYADTDMKKLAFALNVNDENLWSFYGSPRKLIGHCGKTHIKKDIADSPEVIWKSAPKHNKQIAPTDTKISTQKERQSYSRKEVAVIKNYPPKLGNNIGKKSEVAKKQIKKSSAFIISLDGGAGNNRRYVSVSASSLKGKHRCVFNISGDNNYFINTTDLIELLKVRRMSSVVYKDTRGECWNFYVDGSGRIYKNASDRQYVKELSPCNIV